MNNNHVIYNSLQQRLKIVNQEIKTVKDRIKKIDERIQEVNQKIEDLGIQEEHIERLRLQTSRIWSADQIRKNGLKALISGLSNEKKELEHMLNQLSG